MEKIDQIITSSLHAIIYTDSESRIILWNPAAENLFGWSSLEVLGNRLTDIIKCQEPSLSQHLERKDLGESFPVQGKILSRTGDIHLVEFLLSLGLDKNDQECKIIFANDLSNQWLREDLLQKTVAIQSVVNTMLHVSLLDKPLKERLQMILDLTLDIDLLNLHPRGAISLVRKSPFMLRMATHKGLRSEHVNDCHSVHGNHCVCGYVARTGEIRSKAILTSPENSLVSPCLKFYPDSTHIVLPIKISGNVLGVVVLFGVSSLWQEQHPDGMEILMAVSNVLAATIGREKVLIDQGVLIERLQRTNIKLLDERKFSESVIDNLLIGILIIDLDNEVSSCNSCGIQIIRQFYPGEVIGTPLDEVMGNKLSEIFLHEFLLEHGGNADQVRKKAEFICLTGKLGMLEYCIVPLYDSKKYQVGKIISFTDITEECEAAKKIAAMARLNTSVEIASTVAHELRNPLAGIKAISQGVLSSLGADDQNREPLGRVVRQIDRLNNILTEFFDYSHPSEPVKKYLSLGRIVAEVIRLVASQAKKKGIALVNRFDDTMPQVMVDCDQMQQVFLNIILNALDATPDTGIVEITYEVTEPGRVNFKQEGFQGLDANKRYLLVLITDSGLGMLPEVLDHLFEPFFTTKSQGTGLGLSVVSRLMKDNGANIYVKSIHNDGSSFYLFFQLD